MEITEKEGAEREKEKEEEEEESPGAWDSSGIRSELRAGRVLHSGGGVRLEILDPRRRIQRRGVCS